jgi:hypothetical protein
MAGVVFDNNDVAGEERRMRAAQVHQHAVMPGNRDDFAWMLRLELKTGLT